jgi:hypothetical protein
VLDAAEAETVTVSNADVKTGLKRGAAVSGA